MSSSAVALNLVLADQFLETARWAHQMGFHNVSHTNSVNCAIRAKDAIAIKLAGKTRRLMAHGRAVDELADLPQAADLAAALNRILQDKNRFEYSDELASQARSADQLARVERFLAKVKTLCL